jgi:peroxiredoxin
MRKAKQTSKQVAINTPALDFTLLEFNGNRFVLSEYKTKKNVLLVFNRGFT